MKDDYKLHEDNNQEQYLDYLRENEESMLTSCRHLSRRMLHSWNCYSYACEADDADGCPKVGSGRRGIADKSCLTDPYSIRMGSDNNEQDDFREK